MKANPLYLGQGPEFWAYVRLITRGLDASDRKTHAIKHYSMDDIFGVVLSGGYPSAALGTREWPSQLAVDLFNYFDYRSNILNGEVERSLMDVDEAAQSFRIYAMILALEVVSLFFQYVVVSGFILHKDSMLMVLKSLLR